MRSKFGKPWIGMLFVLGTSCRGVQHKLPFEFLDPDSGSGSAAAVVVDNAALVHTAQVLPLDETGRLVGEGSVAAQADRVLDNLAAVLAEAHSDLGRVVKLNVTVTLPSSTAAVKSVFARRFAFAAKPAISFGVGNLHAPAAALAVDAVAWARLDPGPSVKRMQGAAVLPAGTRVYAGSSAKGDGLASAARQTMENLRGTLKSLGSAEDRVVQAKVYLRPLSGSEEVRKEMAGFFGEGRVPPLVFVEWEKTGRVEIEVIAWAGPERPGEVIEYFTQAGRPPSPQFSWAVRVNHGRSIYFSGLSSPTAKNSDGEVRDIFASLGRLLARTGSDFRHLAKATYSVASEEAGRAWSDLRPRYYDPRRPPAACMVAMAALAPEGVSTTLDMIAVPVPRESGSKSPISERRVVR